MKVKDAIRRIRKYRPTSPAEFKKAGINILGPVGAGAFREVVRIAYCPLVVKFPLAEGTVLPGEEPDRHRGIAHSALEMKKLARLKRFQWMRPYLPKVYYYDRKSGVIVMQYYPEMDEEKYLYGNAKFVQTLIRRLTGVIISDYCRNNVGRGVRALPVLIDCGY